MTNISTRNKHLLWASIGVGVLLVGGFGWLSWRDWTEVQETAEASAALQAKITRSEAEIRKIPALEENVLVLRERVKEYVTILPDDAEVTALVDKLTEFAKDSGAEITKLDDTVVKQRLNRKEKAAEAFDRVTFKLSLVATCDEYLTFLDLFENKYERFVNIPSFKVAAFDDRGRQESGSAPERAHKIDLDLETYVYNSKSRGGDMVSIPKERQKLEKLRELGRLEASAGDLKPVRYDLQPVQGRRDPFVDPRLVHAPDGKVPEEERRRQLKTLDELKNRLKEIVEAVKKEEGQADAVRRLQMQEANDARILELDAEVTRLAQAEWFTVPEYAAEADSAVVAPLKALKEQRGAPGLLKVGPQEIEERVASLEAALASGDYRKAVTLAQELQQLRARIKDDERLIPIFQRAEDAGRKAATFLEFAAMDFRFGGCVCFAADPSQSVIIINERSFSPGETVADGLVITSITAHDIAFDFRGVSVTRRHAVDGGR